MKEAIHYSYCPVCGSTHIQFVFDVKDYTVSGELFPVFSCTDCLARFTQNIPDSASIGAYYKSEDYISHTNTTRGLINRLYQWVRKRTLRQKRKLVERTTGIKAGKLLDIGCGTGAFLNEMRQNNWEITGLEPDADARSVAYKLYNIAPEEMDHFFDLEAESYDVITLWHVLEHVHNLQGYLRQLKSLLKDNGRLFIAVPNYTSKDAAVYKEFWAAYDVPRHLYHFSPLSMQRLVEKHGMTIEKLKPMWYDSFYVSMLSSKYKHGKTNLVGSFRNGLISNMNAAGNSKKCSSIIYVVKK